MKEAHKYQITVLWLVTGLYRSVNLLVKLSLSPKDFLLGQKTIWSVLVTLILEHHLRQYLNFLLKLLWECYGILGILKRKRLLKPWKAFKIQIIVLDLPYFKPNIYRSQTALFLLSYLICYCFLCMWGVVSAGTIFDHDHTSFLTAECAKSKIERKIIIFSVKRFKLVLSLVK